jgi:RND family efflux transporter MFP subunit
MRYRFSFLLAVLFVPACSKSGTPDPGVSVPSPSKVVLHRHVELGVAAQKSLVVPVETIGILEAEGTTDIAAGVTGVVDEVFFREGDEVQPGRLLVTIDQRRFQVEEELAQTNVQRAKAALDLARDLADRNERAGLGVSEEDKSKTRGQFKVAEAEYRASLAALARASHNLDRSRVRAPYPGRINKRLVTKGSYLEEKTSIATIADLSKIRLVGYVPESAAPVLREMFRRQEERLELARLGLVFAMTPCSSQPTRTLNGNLLGRDYVLSGYDPEFELLALPGETFHGRIFYMSTVANSDTHQFEVKAEVLGWVPPRESLPEEPPKLTHREPHKTGLVQLDGEPAKLDFGRLTARPREPGELPKLWPGYTARVRFPVRTSPAACVIPEEAMRASERGFICFVPKAVRRDDGGVEWVAEMRSLEVGLRADGLAEIRKGLEVGEKVVRRGAEALENGTPIVFAK